MNLLERIMPDIKKYELDTGHKFRTAFRKGSKGNFHPVVQPADLLLPDDDLPKTQ